MIDLDVVREDQGQVAGAYHAEILRDVLLPGVPTPNRVPGHHVEEHHSVPIDHRAGRVAVVLRSRPADRHEVLRVLLGRPLVAEDRR